MDEVEKEYIKRSEFDEMFLVCGQTLASHG